MPLNFVGMLVHDLPADLKWERFEISNDIVKDCPRGNMYNDGRVRATPLTFTKLEKA